MATLAKKPEPVRSRIKCNGPGADHTFMSHGAKRCCQCERRISRTCPSKKKIKDEQVKYGP